MTLLSFEHVSKCYPDGRGEIAVLNDVSLEIDESDFVGIWGLRRSGKTTLMRIAAGMELPDEGSVSFDGQDLAQVSADTRVKLLRGGGIGLASADWRPTRNKPAIEHVALPLLADGMSLREAREPARRVLERMGVSGCAHMFTDRLSQDERIRVGLAQALIHAPRLLLVDEPATLHSPSERIALYQLLHALGRDSKSTLVIASEDVAPLRKARRIMSIDRGTLRSMDKPGMVVAFPGQRMSPGRRRQGS
jgi:predicted ABC-type transport system involved in lysophospholipase L1 biosynthesis ATPase subunit